MRILAWGRLLRISLAPSAVADIAAGIVLAAGTWPGGWRAYALMLASLCVYHGGMALNDWADQDEDARGGRPRPIPSRAIRSRTALRLALVLLLAGPLLALAVAPSCALVLGSVAALAAYYDLAGRGPLLGPLLLAACRAGNLSAGIVLGLEFPLGGVPVHLQVVLLYGLYVFYVSRLARLEDAPDTTWKGARPRLGLGLVALLLVLIGALRLVLLFRASGLAGMLEVPTAVRTGALLAAAAGCGGAFGLIRRSLRRVPWSRGDVMTSVGMALRRLLVATAAIAAQAGTSDGLWIAAAILCGYPLSFTLRRAFPPT